MRGKGTLCIKGVIILLTALVLQGTNWAAAEELTVMTRNLYLGADLIPLIKAQTEAQFESAVFDILGTIEANSFPERAAALAAEIVEKKPHLVGLQEVLNFTIDGANSRPPFYDYLQELLNALKAQGANYRVVAVVKNLDLVFPFDINRIGVPNLIGALDRDVILARDDVKDVVVLTGLCPESQVSDNGCNYQFAASLPNPLEPLDNIVIKRGFVAIDALVDGFPVRFVNTHLEGRDFGPLLQAAQAFELTQILAALNSELGAPIIVVGDFNSDPRDPVLAGPIVPPYLQLTAAGFVDAWTQHRPGNPDGYTCCQEEDLMNRKSVLSERVDLIFSSEEPEKVKVHLVGDKIPDKTPSGLWPSDHAGVVGRMEFAQ
ncbi:MAG TPA: endonuclease/exonuclease/phosphatase family protein [Nitrospirota bacterium]|nr:endonuclease/exonuclease/phosphatase family protein [Nitrospirota bacterium]